MSHYDNIKFLYSLEKFGIKLGLKNTEYLLERIGNPQFNYKTVHIAGTNGKGSVSSFIASILREASYNVGHYTSPHLIEFNERIKINNIQISNNELAKYTNLIKNDVIEKRATFFEATTAIAFKYFADKLIDFGIIETGLGGRFDSTNVLNPLVSVITNISIDHIQQLGSTIESIAKEKAGIIKVKTPCVTGSENETALEIFRQNCNEKEAELYNINELFRVTDYKIEEEGLFFSASDKKENYELYSPVNGKHQIKNILCAIQSIILLKQAKHVNISKQNIINGIKNVSLNTGLNCRFEIYSKNPLIILDVAHNVGSITALVDIIKSFRKRKVHLIFGVMKDKDYEKVIELLSSISDHVYCVQPVMDRALSIDSISELFSKKVADVKKYRKISTAIDDSLSKMGKEDLILITGSHYVCGEALLALREKCLDKI
jgi:dihydrofolate synthase / folylpolyglutamate synthase